MGILNERIKKRRNQLGLTLLQVAEQLGVKDATVQRYESGEIKNIKHDTITSLSKILKCSPEYLMGWKDSINLEGEEDPDIVKIQRARISMNDNDKERMMKILELSFEEYFKDN